MAQKVELEQEISVLSQQQVSRYKWVLQQPQKVS